MNSPCDKCEKYCRCTSPCDKITKLIPRDIEAELKSKFREEIPISRTKTEEKIKSADSKKGADLDMLEKIDLFRSADQDEDSDTTSNPDTMRKIKDCIKYVNQNENNRRQYRKYLGCTPMTRIAKRAGVTKQTIQKKFSRITTRISEMYAKRYNEEISNVPLKFKKAGGACRIEFR
jgi:hypothetical protein